MRKFMVLILAISMCFSITPVAFADNVPEGVIDNDIANIGVETAANLRAKIHTGTWVGFFWKLLADWSEKLCSLDSESENDSNWTYLVTPDVEYNTGEMGNEVYFRPEADTVGQYACTGIELLMIMSFIMYQVQVQPNIL